MDRVVSDNEVVIITRKNAEAVAILPESELRSMLETIHLLRSPKNRQRLLEAYKRAEERSVAPLSIAELRKEVGLV